MAAVLAHADEWERVGAQRDATVQIFRLSGISGPGRSALDKGLNTYLALNSASI